MDSPIKSSKISKTNNESSFTISTNGQPFILQAKGMGKRRKVALRQVLNCKPNLTKDQSDEKCSDMKKKKHDWEDATCSVCMEYPHNAVLLLCSSYDKGCRPYMCRTSRNYSNCLNQYKRAYTKVSAAGDASSFVSPPVSSSPIGKHAELAELACPLCRGQVKGYTVVEAAREYLNGKERNCMEDKCSFVGTYKKLRKHVKSKHPFARPREVDPAIKLEWKRLEWERERRDAISIVTSLMPGSVVSGDYVIDYSSSDDYYSSDDDSRVGFYSSDDDSRVGFYSSDDDYEYRR